MFSPHTVGAGNLSRMPRSQSSLVSAARPRAVAPDVGVFVVPEVVFPGIKGTERELTEVLATLSRDDVLFHAARLNTLISGPGDFDTKGRQQAALNWMCASNQIDKINEFIRSRGPVGGPVTIFFRGQCLELMRWAARYCKNLPDDGKSFESAELRENFFKALLIAGVLWGGRVYSDKLKDSGNLDEARRRALGAFRKGIEESNLGPHLGVALGRGKALFVDHFPARYPEFADAFLRATGLSIDQYRSCVASLSIYTIFNRADGPMFLAGSVGAATALRDIFPKYFSLEAQTPDQLAQSFWKDFDKQGYRALRERPIMVVADGRAIVLDPTFYAEKVSIGPLFHLLGAVKGGKANEIFGRFGLAFEDYVAAILRRMYPSRPPLVDRILYSLKGRNAERDEFEIDASLLDVRAAVVFEVKAAWLREDAISDGAPETFLQDIRKKYGISPTPGERGKGVAQLARSVGAIVRGEWLGPKREFEGITVFYPVLLVHDTRFDTPALGSFLDAEFRVLLGEVPAGKVVAPITIMTVQDIESLESSVETFSFVDLLAAYTLECRDRVQSLHNYMAFSDYGKRIVPSRHLMESSSEILAVLERELFEKPTKESS